METTNYIMPVLFVNNIAVSKNFYQALFSLEIEHDFGENIVFKDAFSIWQKERADQIIFNAQRTPSGEGLKNIELYFESDEIVNVWEKIKAKGVEVIHGLKEEDWGQRTVRFLDPDKYLIEVAEPMEQVILRMKREGLSASAISDKTQMPLAEVREIIKEK